MQERQNLEQSLSEYELLKVSFSDTMDIYQLALDENDPDLLEESQKNIIDIQKKVQLKYIETLFSGEVDSNDTYLEIHAGAGGTDDCFFGRFDEFGSSLLLPFPWASVLLLL